MILLACIGIIASITWLAHTSLNIYRTLDE